MKLNQILLAHAEKIKKELDKISQKPDPNNEEFEVSDP